MYGYVGGNPTNAVDPSGLRPGLPNWNLMDAARLIRPLNQGVSEAIETMILDGTITIADTPGAGGRTDPRGISISPSMSQCDGKGAFGKKLVLAGTLWHERRHYRVLNGLEAIAASYTGDWWYSELEQNQAELEFLEGAKKYYGSDPRFQELESRQTVAARIILLRTTIDELRTTGSYNPNSGNSLQDWASSISVFAIPRYAARLNRWITQGVR